MSNETKHPMKDVVFNGKPCTFKGVDRKENEKLSVTIFQAKQLEAAGVIVTIGGEK